MSQLKAFSTLTGDVLDLGLASEDPGDLLQLADTMATNRPGLIVYAEAPLLQKWSDL